MAKVSKVSVIILSWNGKEDTLETIMSLAKSNVRDFTLEICVVDNGSTDGSPEAIKELYNSIQEHPAIYCGDELNADMSSPFGGKPRSSGRGGCHKKISNSPVLSMKIIELGENLGFAEGNNVGMKEALEGASDYIALLNNDTFVDKNLVVNILQEHARLGNVGVISPKIYFSKGFEFQRRYKSHELGKVIWYAGGKIDWDNVYGSNRGVDEIDEGQFDETVETDFATGCFAMYKAQALRDVGFYDKRYFAYMEDVDHSQRLKKSGWGVVYSPKGFLWHKVSQSSGIGSGMNDYFLTRNRMLFGMKYASLRTKFALLRESVKLLLKGRKWQKIGARDFFLGNFRKGSWQ